MKYLLDTPFIKRAQETCKEYISTIRKCYREHSRDYYASGLWGIPLEQEELDAIHTGFLEGMVLSSFGIIHHTDFSDQDILLPLSKNAPKFRIKYYDWVGTQQETNLTFLKPILFNANRLHSLAPAGIPHREPIILLALSVPKDSQAVFEV